MRPAMLPTRHLIPEGAGHPHQTSQMSPRPTSDLAQAGCPATDLHQVS